MTLDDQKIEHVLAVAGALVPLFSALASLLNHVVRKKQAEGQAVHPMLLATGSFLNVASVNLDKAVQLGKMVRGGAAAAPVAPAPVAEAPAAALPAAVPAACPTCGQPVPAKAP